MHKSIITFFLLFFTCALQAQVSIDAGITLPMGYHSQNKGQYVGSGLRGSLNYEHAFGDKSGLFAKIFYAHNPIGEPCESCSTIDISNWVFGGTGPVAYFLPKDKLRVYGLFLIGATFPRTNGLAIGGELGLVYSFSNLYIVGTLTSFGGRVGIENIGRQGIAFATVGAGLRFGKK